MTQNEASVKSTLSAKLKQQLPSSVHFRHEDVLTSGTPDSSISWNGRTTWWETKYARPAFKSRGIQELMLKRLARESRAFYVIFCDFDATKSVAIVDPAEFEPWKVPQLVRVHDVPAIVRFDGFDYNRIIDFIRRVHSDLE